MKNLKINDSFLVVLNLGEKMKNLNEKRELAAAFRWFARLDMNEGIANHFSLAVSDDGQNFLMNPVGKFWSKIKSSDILELDARIEPKNIGPVVDETAWCIHGAIHRKVPKKKFFRDASTGKLDAYKIMKYFDEFVVFFLVDNEFLKVKVHTSLSE